MVKSKWKQVSLTHWKLKEEELYVEAERIPETDAETGKYVAVLYSHGELLDEVCEPTTFDKAIEEAEAFMRLNPRGSRTVKK